MVKSYARFSYADRRLQFSGKKLLQNFLLRMVGEESGLPCQLNYVFCSDTFLHDMNLRFLNHDDFTDIITFDLSYDRNLTIVGEIYISIDRVKENAISLGLSFREEVLRVVFHGALHLIGYKDKTNSQSIIMRAMEEKWMAKFKLESST